MKKSILLLIVISFFGCEEIIEIDINSTDPQIIIEANLTNSLNKNFVKITKSTDYFKPNEYEFVSNAEVSIKVNNGTSYLLDEVSPGVYKDNQIFVKENNEYLIEVKSNNTIYSAKSFAPKKMVIDSVNYILETRHFNKDKKFLELHVYFQDQNDLENFARFVIYKNGKQINRIFLYKDRLTNGNYIDFSFFNFRDEEFQAGDIITVEMHSIEKQTFNYFNTLKNVLATSSGGPFGSTAPANPSTNWNNNAYGHFSAYTLSIKSVSLK